MATNNRRYDESARRDAKRICRLNDRQIEMACALGMNLKKLARLRPGPRERWKLPVGEFIEQCYWNRFGGETGGRGNLPMLGPHKPSTSGQDAHERESVRDVEWQVADLICYLTNLADDLEKLLAQRRSARVLPAIAKELRAIAEAIESGRSISPFPEFTVPFDRPARTFSQQGQHKRKIEGELPF